MRIFNGLNIPPVLLPQISLATRDDSPPWQHRWFLAGALSLLLAGIAAFMVDVHLARLLYRDRILTPVHTHVELFEPWGDASGVILVACIVVTFDVLWRQRVLSIIACGWGAGLMADIPKLIVNRTRPKGLDFDTVRHAGDTFLGLFQGFNSRFQSFPSAHTATAFGLATALCVFYPKGRWVFLPIAFLVGVQRANTGAHYLSDTLCGAAIGVATATFCLRYAPRWTIEAKWSTRAVRVSPVASQPGARGDKVS